MTIQRKMNTRFSSLRKALRQLGYAALATLPMLGSVQAATDEFVYFHTDALGSPTAAFNEAGEVCWVETYSPYGEKQDKEDSLAPAAGCGLLGTDVGYTGHVQDGSGLVYAQQRYYDPVIGRFMSTDPVKPTDSDLRLFGRYHYAFNNPYAFVDPDGRYPGGPNDTDGDGEVDDDLESELLSPSGKPEYGDSYLDNKLEDMIQQQRNMMGGVAGATSSKLGGPKTAPDIKTPYKRPSNATTPAQRLSVQDRPCVDCKAVAPKQFADHKTPLVKEYYETGTIDKTKMRSLDAVQPQCPSCSGKQGAEMKQYSMQQKKERGL